MINNQPDGIHAPLLQVLHVLLRKAPQRVEGVSPRHPWGAFNDNIDPMEIPLPANTVHYPVSGSVDVETCWVAMDTRKGLGEGVCEVRQDNSIDNIYLPIYTMDIGSSAWNT